MRSVLGALDEDGSVDNTSPEPSPFNSTTTAAAAAAALVGVGSDTFGASDPALRPEEMRRAVEQDSPVLPPTALSSFDEPWMIGYMMKSEDPCGGIKRSSCVLSFLTSSSLMFAAHLSLLRLQRSFVEICSF